MKDYAVDRAMQIVFNEYGPERDRGTDWWRCQEQPWFDIATALHFDGIVRFNSYGKAVK